MTANPVATAGSTSADTAHLLRFALRADATLCGGLGLLVAVAADPLARLSGLPATAEWLTGAALVGYGALLYAVSGVRSVRRVGQCVLAGNLAFAVALGVVLAGGWLPLTGFGVAAAVTFAAVTLGFAGLQYLGVRRLARPPHDWSGAGAAHARSVSSRVRGSGVGSGTGRPFATPTH